MKRVSLFKEAIGFIDEQIISNEYIIPFALDVGDIDRDGKNDVVSLSNLSNSGNFVWHRRLPEGEFVDFDRIGETILEGYSGTRHIYSGC